jgi:hypothetical protein
MNHEIFRQVSVGVSKSRPSEMHAGFELSRLVGSYRRVSIIRPTRVYVAALAPKVQKTLMEK